MVPGEHRRGYEPLPGNSAHLKPRAVSAEVRAAGAVQAAPAAPWLRQRGMEHGCLGRASNKESEKLMVRSRERRGRGGKRGWPGYKGVDTHRPDDVKING